MSDTAIQGLSLQAWRVLEARAVTTRGGVVFVRVPRELRRPIAHGCTCAYCVAHPLEVPTWDTVAIPTTAGEYTYTVHMPGAK